MSELDRLEAKARATEAAADRQHGRMITTRAAGGTVYMSAHTRLTRLQNTAKAAWAAYRNAGIKAVNNGTLTF